jgi:magnesium transporter
MGFFEKEIERAVVFLLWFCAPESFRQDVKLGVTASTLVIRALALSEVKLRDWWRGDAPQKCYSGLGLGVNP